MTSGFLKATIKRTFNLLNLEVSRRNYQAPPPPAPDPRNSRLGVLRQMRGVGFTPATVFDIGAAYGSFTLDCLKVFPDARYVLVEPLEENRASLETIAGRAPNTEFVLAAAAARSGETTIHVHPDLTGSSLYVEDEDSNVNGVPRTVPTVAVDDLSRRGGFLPPFMLKLDVQGAELEALRGAQEILPDTECVILEVSFFNFFAGGAQFYDVVTFMQSKGFAAYDIFDLQYRLLDDALSQVDMVFVRSEGLFRSRHCYATRQQREEQTAKLLESQGAYQKNLLDGPAGRKERR